MATITETGTIDLAAQKEAHDEAISTAASDATSKANAAAKTATNYITADNTGIKIHMQQNSTTYQSLTALESTWYISNKKRSSVSGDGLKVFIGNAGSEVEVATFGDTVRLGKSGEGNVYVDSRGLSIYTDSIHEIVSAKNNNDSITGLATIHEILATSFRTVVNASGTHSETILRTEYPVASIISCYEHGTESSLNFAIDSSDNTILYLNGAYYKTVDVAYETNTSIASMKLGAYAQSDGPDSLALGESHTYGSDSLAFGSDCESNGHRSIAGGTFSKANGRSSIAIGEESEANFNGSAAFGNETVANGPYQFVIGRANVINNPYRANNILTENEYVFIIGNGDSSTRSNAFTVDWDGNIYPTKKVVLTSPANRDNPSGTAVYDNDRSLYIVDADGERIGMIRTEQSTGGNITLTLMSIGEKTDGTEVINQISLNSLRDGTKTYYVADQAAFRSAIGASSGTFPTSVGGTGITSNPSMLTNLGSTSAASVFAASPRPGVTGTLPRANGGTGATGRTTGTVTRSGVGTDGTMNVYSNGVTCTLAASNVKLKAALATSSTVQLATLPAGYRPPMNVFTNISSPSQSANGGAWVRIGSDGTVVLGNYSGAQFTTSIQLYFTITWAL